MKKSIDPPPESLPANEINRGYKKYNLNIVFYSSMITHFLFYIIVSMYGSVEDYRNSSINAPYHENIIDNLLKFLMVFLILSISLSYVFAIAAFILNSLNNRGSAVFVIILVIFSVSPEILSYFVTYENMRFSMTTGNCEAVIDNQYTDCGQKLWLRGLLSRVFSAVAVGVAFNLIYKRMEKQKNA